MPSMIINLSAAAIELAASYLYGANARAQGQHSFAPMWEEREEERQHYKEADLADLEREIPMFINHLVADFAAPDDTAYAPKPSFPSKRQGPADTAASSSSSSPPTTTSCGPRKITFAAELSAALAAEEKPTPTSRRRKRSDVAADPALNILRSTRVSGPDVKNEIELVLTWASDHGLPESRMLMPWVVAVYEMAEIGRVTLLEEDALAPLSEQVRHESLDLVFNLWVLFRNVAEIRRYLKHVGPAFQALEVVARDHVDKVARQSRAEQGLRNPALLAKDDSASTLLCTERMSTDAVQEFGGLLEQAMETVNLRLRQTATRAKVSYKSAKRATRCAAALLRHDSASERTTGEKQQDREEASLAGQPAPSMRRGVAEALLQVLETIQRDLVVLGRRCVDTAPGSDFRRITCLDFDAAAEASKKWGEHHGWVSGYRAEWQYQVSLLCSQIARDYSFSADRARVMLANMHQEQYQLGGDGDDSGWDLRGRIRIIKGRGGEEHTGDGENSSSGDQHQTR